MGANTHRLGKVPGLKKAFLTMSVCSAAVGIVSQQAHANTERYALEEVVVTAQKRSESLQDVPISVSSFTADDIKVKRIRAAEDLAMHIPNLQVTTPIGDGVPVFSLRGISMSDFSLAQSSPIATYYDEVHKGTWAIQGLTMYDLERVEVLKGPQGTLYGKNTTGGAVNLITRKPEFETNGYLDLSYGRFNHHSAEGAYETPLTDKLAARVAFTYEKADGYVKNRHPEGKDLNDTDQYGLRTTLRYQPTDAVDLVLRGSLSSQKSDGFGAPPGLGPIGEDGLPVFGGVGGPIYELFGLSGDMREGLTSRRELSSPLYNSRRDLKSHAVSFHADINLNDSLTFTSITSWDKGEIKFAEDADGTPLMVMEARNYGEVSQLTQDFRLTSDNDGPLNFILGAYYSTEDVENWTDNIYFGDIDVNGDGTINGDDCIEGGLFIACEYHNSFDQEKISYAAYSDVTYELSERVTLRGGLRYTHDKLKLKDFMAQIRSVDSVPLFNSIPGNYEGPLDATTTLRGTDEDVSGKIGIDYRISDDVMVYANYGRGYRSAAFNAQAFALPEELTVASPENVNSYEVGFKGELFDRRVRLNAAVFHYDYRNQQVLNVNPATQASILVSLPRSEITGAEFELVYMATENLLLSLSGGFLDTEIKKGEASGVDVAGNELMSAPETNLSGALDWSFPLAGWGSADFRVDASYVSDYHYDLVNSPAATQDGYTMVNSQVRFQPHDEKYSLTLWVKNLTDRTYSPVTYDVLEITGTVYRQVNRPRTYGITVGMTF